ncbi:hypothetical protein A3L22_09680 [Streptomyces griseus subsp. griseus]|nr:hypothetical protein A3L22_09680 [Streptomyces griseus subsp. griseus]
MTHQQLAALIASANPAGASNLASRLSQASSTITKIGEDLKAHVAALPWQGEGGDAFRAWGGQTASATLRLGEYSKGASRWMEEVALAIGEAKAAMPPVSETTQARNALTKANGAYDTATDPANRNDPDARGLARTAQSDAAAAEARIDALRGEAALRLRKLAQTYEFTAHQVNAETPPTFPPPSAFMDMRDGWLPRSGPGEGGGAPARSVNGDSTAVLAKSTAGGEFVSGATGPVRPGPAVGLPHAEVSGPSVHTSRLESATRMEIDGLATLPTPTPPSSAPPPVSPPPVGAPDQMGMQPTPTFPVSGTGGSKALGQPVPSVTGRSGHSGGRSSALPIQGPVGSGASGRLPHDSGIVGGRPMPPNATGAGRGMPRGLVVGGEGNPGARGPMGHTPAMGTGSGGARPGAPAGGRRYTSETGGIVAGSPRQANRSGAHPVTGGGAVARPTTNTPPGRRDDRGADRSDYLIEDEDTWKQNGRRIVPPVVE